MKKVAAAAACLALSLALVGCGGGDAPAQDQPAGNDAPAQEQPKEPEPKPNLSLDGVWAMDGADGTENAIFAVIDGDDMEVYFNIDGSGMIYWAGTYDQPTSPEDAHEWVSTHDKDRTALSFLGSNDDSKEFKYKDGVISFDITIQGDTANVELTKAADEFAKTIIEATAPKFAATLGEGTVIEHDGAKVLVVAANWTNNSDEAAAFDLSISTKAFQDGVQLENAFIYDSEDFDFGADSLDIQPGISQDVWLAYELRSSGVVTVQVSDLWGSDGQYDEKTYAVA